MPSSDTGAGRPRAKPRRTTGAVCKSRRARSRARGANTRHRSSRPRARGPPAPHVLSQNRPPNESERASWSSSSLSLSSERASVVRSVSDPPPPEGENTHTHAQKRGKCSAQEGAVCADTGLGVASRQKTHAGQQRKSLRGTSVCVCVERVSEPPCTENERRFKSRFALACRRARRRGGGPRGRATPSARWKVAAARTCV